jgi:hypothetical protein
MVVARQGRLEGWLQQNRPQLVAMLLLVVGGAGLAVPLGAEGRHKGAAGQQQQLLLAAAPVATAAAAAAQRRRSTRTNRRRASLRRVVMEQGPQGMWRRGERMQHCTTGAHLLGQTVYSLAVAVAAAACCRLLWDSCHAAPGRQQQ